MNEKEQLTAARERVIETIAKNMNLYGISDSIGRLYGLMYFQNQPMTLDEMKEELGMSKTSMSTSVRSLMELKMVEKVWRKGERKDLYKAEGDWHQTFVDQFSIRWRPSITMSITTMEKSKRELESIVNDVDTDEKVRLEALEDIEKLTAALDYYDWLNRLVTSFESGEIFNYIKKENPNKE
ncbi:GbsR/MarR family transcriptional regulator [Cytobacillus gottheilii]|uniref:HTH-type transcriptional regulator n=1 Tax=Cytobacillus gottheilii TaxID=859144 RepID=A0ABX8FGB4_9BACI|nr:GbsR/MarR family transcriptional regulator [Cytobacillus gottheilii]QVY63040.1 GbsR/MarR family transcriptional regulator [Cytobacillus gottheilii]